MLAVTDRDHCVQPAGEWETGRTRCADSDLDGDSTCQRSWSVHIHLSRPSPAYLMHTFHIHNHKLLLLLLSTTSTTTIRVWALVCWVSLRQLKRGQLYSQLHVNCVCSSQWFLVLLLRLLTTTTQHVVLLSLMQPIGGCHANEMQMKNLYSSCAEESNNIVSSNWGRPRFAVCPQYVRVMTCFGPRSAAYTSYTTTITTTTTILWPLYRTTCVSRHTPVKN